MGTHYKGAAAEVRALDAYIKLRRAANTVGTLLERHLRTLGLTGNQLGVLEMLLHLGPLHQHEIGSRLLISRANITLIVDQLSDQGWVRRVRESNDRRLIRVQLTARGRRWISRVFPRHVERIVACFSALDAGEQRELARLCRKLGLANSGSAGAPASR